MSAHAHRHHTIHREHIHHGWNNAFAPRLKIAPGETVHFEIVDASSGQLTQTSTAADLREARPRARQPGDRAGLRRRREAGRRAEDHRPVVPSVGLGLDGKHPRLRLAQRSVPGREDCTTGTTIRASRRRCTGPAGACRSGRFTGTIGVAPAAPGLHSIIPPRNVGGNMDARDIAEGAELYLPIEVDGAIFSVGDTHAAQGDGEVCGTAIESPIDVALKIRSGEGRQSPLAAIRHARSGDQPFRQEGLRGDDRASDRTSWRGPAWRCPR